MTNFANEPFFFPGGMVGCLLVHGFGSSPGEMRELGLHLVVGGYTVQGILLKGHGTIPEDLAKTGWRDWFGSVEESIRELRQRCSQVFIIGLSLGGLLSLHAAAAGLADGVVSLAAPVGLADWKTKLVPLVKYIMPYQKRRISPQQSELNRAVGRFTYDRLPLIAVESLQLFMRIVKQELRAVTVPALIIYSQADQVIAPHSGPHIYEYISSKQKELLALSSSSHTLTVDQEKERVFRAVHEFINKASLVTN